MKGCLFTSEMHTVIMEGEGEAWMLRAIRQRLSRMVGHGRMGRLLYRIRHVRRIRRREDLFIVHIEGCADSLRKKESYDFSLKLPLDFQVPPHSMRLAAVVHVFYPELVPEIRTALNNVPGTIDVYVSTTEDEKKRQIEQAFEGFSKGKVEVRVFPNRGRDIAPAFIGFRDIYKDYDACVHLHTKKSPHAADKLFGWREYLYHNLLGSPEIVGGILNLLSVQGYGAVFPQYYAPLRESINWGQDYELVRKLLARLGIVIDNRYLLEFPAGSMFWYRPQAIKPLLDSGMTFQDFPDEAGQIDGTIAHAIERSFLYIVESEGFRWVKINSCPSKTGNAPILSAGTQEELQQKLEKVWSPVLKMCEDEVEVWM